MFLKVWDVGGENSNIPYKMFIYYMAAQSYELSRSYLIMPLNTSPQVSTSKILPQIRVSTIVDVQLFVDHDNTCRSCDFMFCSPPTTQTSGQCGALTNRCHNIDVPTCWAAWQSESPRAGSRGMGIFLNHH